MRIGKELIDKPIYSVTDGRLIGKVKDVYLNSNLENIVGLYLGSEGLFSRRNILISQERVTLLGLDAVLVAETDVVMEEEQLPEAGEWLRRQTIQGRGVDTTGGTKVGLLGDIIFTSQGKVAGFKLARVFVEGPIARKQAISREVVVDVGHVDSTMTIDLAQAEQNSFGLE